jgi:hypothetical protein
MTKGHWSHAGQTDVNVKDMRCGGEEPFPSNASVAAVTAGSTVGFFAEGTVGHPGPLQFYMAQVPTGQEVSSWEGSGKVWFKIAADKPAVDAKTGLKFPSQGLYVPWIEARVVLLIRCVDRFADSEHKDSEVATQWKLLAPGRTHRPPRCCQRQRGTDIYPMCPVEGYRGRERNAVAQGCFPRGVLEERSGYQVPTLLSNVRRS